MHLTVRPVVERINFRFKDHEIYQARKLVGRAHAIALCGFLIFLSSSFRCARDPCAIASDEISARSQPLIPQLHDRRGAQCLAGTRGTCG